MVKFENENLNSAKNFNSVTIGNIKLYFSYETCIAFEKDGKMVVTANNWGNTTGKHLNWISSKEDRIPYEDFQKELNKLQIIVK